LHGKIKRYSLALLFITSLYVYPTCTNAKDVPFLINNGQYPDPNNLADVNSIASIKELYNAVNEIVPKVYSESEKFKTWRLSTITPLKKAPLKSYYGLGEHFCGKNEASKSWFVEILFPKFLPAFDASHGQLFIAKTKQNEWFAWFRFH